MKVPVSAAVVLVLLLTPLQVNAGGHGGGGGGRGGGVHFGGAVRGGFFNGQFVNGHNTFGFVTRNNFARRHFLFARGHFRDRNNFDDFGGWPWGWGNYGSYGVPYTDDDYSMTQTPPLQTHVTCQHTEEKVTVPSLNGGTADVTILRC